jgi:hypothetical protein
MNITKEYLQGELVRMEKQRNHAHEVAIACQAAIDTLQALVQRLDAPEPEIPTFSDLGLPDPIPIEEANK